MDRFVLLKPCPIYPESLEMESLLKHSSIVLDDINTFDDAQPKSTILLSNNSSSSSSSLSIRSHSPDFSSSLDQSLSRKSIESIDPKKAERLRQFALNKSLEEISRELKEIETCFQVAEEILQKEKERDKQLYDRERRRRTEGSPKNSPPRHFNNQSNSDTNSGIYNNSNNCNSGGSSSQNQNYSNNNSSSSNNTYSDSAREIKSSPKECLVRKRSIKKPATAVSPTYKIYSPNNRIRSSPVICNARLYFKNGKVGCIEAENAKTNINSTHQIVKEIIKKETVHPLVPYENVKKVLCRHDSSDPSITSTSSVNSTVNLTSAKSVELNRDNVCSNDELEAAGGVGDMKFDEAPPEQQHSDELVVADEEYSTPIVEEKIRLTEPPVVLNEQYRKISEHEIEEKIPRPASGGSIDRRKTQSPDRSLHPERHQFVRERLRHLVNRFSDRTRRMRHRLDVPPTPSSSSMSSTSPSSQQQSTLSIQNIIKQNEQQNINNGISAQNHSINCGYWISPIFCGRGHEEDGLDPQGRFYISWLFIVSLSFLYNAWVIPLRSSFPFQNESNTTAWLTVDYIADLIYLLDVIFVKHRLIYLENGFWQTRRQDTRINYIKKLQFKLDVIALVPLDLLYLKYGVSFVFLRVPRLLKIQSFWEFFKLLDRVISSPFMVRVAKTLTYMLYMIHLTACAYYAYSAFEGLGTNRWVFSGKGHPYVRCFAFATKTATSIGKNPKPENDGELLFMTAAWLMGVFIFALLIGQIRDIIATATRSQSEFKQLVDETLEYMRRLHLPDELQRRVKMWFTFTWEQQRTLDESHILDTLPANLKTDIAISVHMQTLSKVQLFAECDEALLRELVLKLRSVTFVPGDHVCQKGEVGKEMYIIKVGEVLVMGGPKNDEVLATLSKGSYFGEISLLAINGAEGNRRTADVRSKGFSNLFVLSKSDLNEALVHYPDAQAILKRRARSLMRKNAAREASRTNIVKTAEVADVVIKNPKRPQSPPPKIMTAIMQSLPKESFAVTLLTQGSRRYNKVKMENEKSMENNQMTDDEYDKPPKVEILDDDLLFSIQNELKNKMHSMNLTDNEKKFLTDAANPDLIEMKTIDEKKMCDVPCDVHREM